MAVHLLLEPEDCTFIQDKSMRFKKKLKTRDHQIAHATVCIFKKKNVKLVTITLPEERGF